MSASCCEAFFTPRGRIISEIGRSQAKNRWSWSSASSCSTLAFRMQTWAWQPPIQHLMKLPGGNGISRITHNMKAILILDCIEMHSRKLWSYLHSYCVYSLHLYLLCCVSGCNAQMSDAHTIYFVPLNPQTPSLLQESGLDPLASRVSASLASLSCCTVNMQ